MWQCANRVCGYPTRARVFRLQSSQTDVLASQRLAKTSDWPWNSGPEWDVVEVKDALAIGGGNGTATVELSKDEQRDAHAAAKRTKSDSSSNPTTGADLGVGPGAGRTEEVELAD